MAGTRTPPSGCAVLDPRRHRTRRGLRPREEDSHLPQGDSDDHDHPHQPQRLRAREDADRDPRRFLRCISCGTIKKERSYALCAECYRTSGALPKAWFTCFIRHAVREAPQYSYRNDPRFEQACRVYVRRQQRAAMAAAVDALLPPLRRREPRDPRDLHSLEEYDGLGPYDLSDLVDAQYGAELPTPERSSHRELSDAEIARWDAQVDGWAEAHGFRLAEEPAPEIQPWGTSWRSTAPSSGPTT